ARPAVVGWDRLIGVILLVVFFVPIGRYELPASLPFNLDLYRIVVALCVLAWVTSLLIDPEVLTVRTAFDRPLTLILICVAGSELTNPGRVEAYSSYVVKGLMFFGSYMLVYYLAATTLKHRSSVEF